MKVIYYRVDIVWCKYPFNHEIDYKFVTFYERVKKKYIMLTGLSIDSNTSIEQKQEYLCAGLNVKKVTVKKIK